MTRARELRGRAALVVAGATVALLLCELLLRLAGFEFGLYPTRVQVGWPDPLTLRRQYEVDRQLLWVPKTYSSTLAAARRTRPTVVFMGDSCTEFGHYDTSFALLVTERHPGASPRFANVGVGGWSSHQGVQQLERDIVSLRPRVVTFYYGWNDHWSSFGVADKDIGRFNLEHSGVLLQLSRFRVAQLINRAVFATTVRRVRGQVRVSLSDFRSNLTRLVRTARAHDIVPVLLTAPSSHRPGAEPAYLAERWLDDLHDLVPLHQRYVQAVRDVAASEQAPLVDLEAEFARLPGPELDALFKMDGIHLTEAGDRRIARVLYERFLAMDLIGLTLAPASPDQPISAR
ncbi:MAG: GDSL-type esterase/lipase family protein [Vicinamibacterales bacterium]